MVLAWIAAILGLAFVIYGLGHIAEFESWIRGAKEDETDKRSDDHI